MGGEPFTVNEWYRTNGSAFVRTILRRPLNTRM
jgi:hypothetical protein